MYCQKFHSCNFKPANLVALQRKLTAHMWNQDFTQKLRENACKKGQFVSKNLLHISMTHHNCHWSRSSARTSFIILLAKTSERDVITSDIDNWLKNPEKMFKVPMF
jgi:hypothetical protein